MNINNILNLLDFDKVDKEEVTSTAARRGFIKKAGNLGFKAALASLPVVLTMMPKMVKAQGSGVIGVLNFALTLEYLEDEFYRMGLDASGLIPDSDKTVFMQISKHETEHVAFLKSALGSAAVPKPVFDFTAQGAFPNAFSDYATFLTLSQAFEDTGVRAYKGQAGNLMTDDNVLTAALQIHSVEARHASEVRRLRAKRLNISAKGWITGNASDTVPWQVYEGEDNTTHGGADLNSIASLNEFSLDSKTEAFDEPLSRDQVLAIVKPFILRRS
jgi:hypothetical protein